MSELYDTHAHLDFPDFAEELPLVLANAQAAGVTRIITIGTDLESSRAAIRLAERYSSVFAAVGCHPNHAHEAPLDVREELTELAKHPRVVAIGETGLDYHRLPEGEGAEAQRKREALKEKQAAIFLQQLEVASSLGLNCIIHQRDSYKETLAAFAPFAARVQSVFHCFGGSTSQMEEIVEMGSLVSFTGILTFKSAANLRETFRLTPSDRFMLETDCPYLAPVPHRGKRCEPAFVSETASVAATVKEWELERLGELTSETAMKFFPKMAERRMGQVK